MKGLFQRIVRSAVAWTFLATFLRVGANIFILPLILRKLPPEHLGLWYVFAAIGGLASLLDLGFEPTITRMASYAWGGASRFAAFGIHLDEERKTDGQPNLSLLSDLVGTLKAYYFWVGIAILFLTGVGGEIWVWRETAHLSDATSLRTAWMVYAVGACLGFISGRWPALLTGVGALKEGQHVQIYSLLFYYAAAAIGLLAGFGIWGLVLATVGMAWVLQFLGRVLFRRMALPNGLPRARFHREIFSALWPNAWRMGLVAIGAFLIRRASTLVCSAYLGLKMTASYGISFQLVVLLAGLSNVWVLVKIPSINQLRVQNRNEDIIRIFAGRMRLMILSYFAGALAILFAGPAVLGFIGSKTTLLPTAQLGALLLINFLETHHSLYGELIFTENWNPFVKPALISGAAIVLLSVILTPRFGIWGLLVSVGVVQASYNNWWPIFRALRGLNLGPAHYFFNILLKLHTK